MSTTAIITISLTALSGILATLLASKSGKLKRMQEKLESKEIELSIKQQELEAVRDIQEKFKASRKRQAPAKVEAPAGGDSDSRLARLNVVPDTEGGN